jgi:putative RNA 2'-phosphotransferase
MPSSNSLTLNEAMNKKETTNIGKFLSLVLRHQPQLIDIELDEQGWTNVDELLKQANAHGKNLTIEFLNHVIETNSKKRFAFSHPQDSLGWFRSIPRPPSGKKK